jgi:hypothetical protein
MKDWEHIPSGLFDLIDQKDFASLTPNEQKEVMACFTPEEFDELHRASAEAKKMHTDVWDVSPNVSDELLQAFNRKYTLSRKDSRSLILYPVQLWKVAAMFLLLAGGVTWIIHFTSRKEITYITLKDTLYVPSFTSNESNIGVYDTVYSDNREPSDRHDPRNVVRHRVEMTVAEPHESSDYIDVYIPPVNLLSVRERDAVPNQQKGNSLKDDSLLQHYRFVRL